MYPKRQDPVIQTPCCPFGGVDKSGCVLSVRPWNAGSTFYLKVTGHALEALPFSGLPMAGHLAFCTEENFIVGLDLNVEL